MKYAENWEKTSERFIRWWRGEHMDRPLLRIIAKREIPTVETVKVIKPASPYEHHLGAARKVTEMKNFCKTHVFLADAYPYVSVDIGPGSMATYLGSEPVFNWDTVWYRECIEDWGKWRGFKFDPDNKWWLLHYSLVKEAVRLAGGEFPIAITDIIESIDTLSAMRGAQNLCYDLIDEPEMIREQIGMLDELYFRYYDAMYDAVKLPDGSSCYMCYNIWGPGKTAKVQCDFSAMMSPSQFREFELPSLTQHCKKLDFSMYHLDGPDAIKHLDAIMGVKELGALQWTPGAGKPDGGSERWFTIYEKVRTAGKSLWIKLTDGGIDDWIAGADRIVREFGNQGLYFRFPHMKETEAARLMDYADSHWR